MKHTWILLLFLAGALAAAQDNLTVTVKSSEVSNGVVIVNAVSTATSQTKTSFELHCNKGASACKTPEPGTYLMVRLPKNWGMYDCANVDLYAATADPAKDQKIGEYCLAEK